MFHRKSVISFKSEQKTKAIVIVTSTLCSSDLDLGDRSMEAEELREWSALKWSKAEVELLVYTRSVNLHSFRSVIYLMNASMSPTAGM